MGEMASQIISLAIVYSAVYSCADQRKHQLSASLVFVQGITGEFPAQRAGNAESVSIWWRHMAMTIVVIDVFVCQEPSTLKVHDMK